MVKNIFTLLLIAIVGLYIYQSFIRSSDAVHGEKAPQISTKLVSGEEFKLSDLEGNYVLLDFWASWCGPCIKDSPKVVNLYNQFNGKNFKDADNFEVVSVALERNDRNWKKASDKFGFGWKYQIVDIQRFVRLSEIANAYDVTNIPSKFLINPKGEIIGVDLSAQEMERLLSDRLM